MGVPRDPACEGQGDAIPDCLIHEAMQEVVDPVSMVTLLPVCETLDAGTRAYPARAIAAMPRGPSLANGLHDG